MIGLAVITYNRLDYLKQTIAALNKNNWGGADIRLIVCDGNHDPEFVAYLDSCEISYINLPKNKGVATVKNTALKEMYNRGCEHLFVIEDDILMKHPQTCQAYIMYAQQKKLHHLNFALHGPLNKGNKFLYNHDVTVYPHCVGAFSYYTRECIQKVGYMDQNFINAWEHVEHTYRIVKAGMTTPFWYFADCPISDRLLEEIPGSIENSAIRPRPDWMKNIQEGQEYWIKKHGSFLPPMPHEKIMQERM